MTYLTSFNGYIGWLCVCGH